MRPKQIFAVLLVCGTASGLIAWLVGIVAFAAFDFITWHPLDGYDIIVPGGWHPHLPAGLLSEMGQVFVRGLPVAVLTGLVLAIPVQVVVRIWRKALLAPLLCASLAANCCLIINIATARLPTLKTEILRVLLLNGIAMIVGAIYGFLLVYFANRLEKLMANRTAQ